jgi:hypothetical protein
VKRVEATWLDSAVAHNRPWIADDEWIKVVACTTIGYLIRKGKRTTTIAQSIHDSGQRGNVIAIPTCAITKMRRLK